MHPTQIVIFDYSGTLSLRSVLFADPDFLMDRLRESGLFDLGVKTLDFFWREIVAPTWEEGSTTHAGYAPLIARRLQTLFPEKEGDGRKINDAASRFVRSYMDHSTPDRRWKPLLRYLTYRKGTAVIVATDHYTEATAAILRFLEDLTIPAVPASEVFQNPETSNRVIVANSADLGFPKGDRRFWETLKKGLHLETVRRVLCVDDFGFNEGAGDPYGALEKVEARKERTIGVLEDVFPGDVWALPFLLLPGDETFPLPRNQETLYSDMILRTTRQVEAWVAEG